MSLVATREGKPDNGGTLLWFPAYGQFGQWGREHKNAIRFVCVTWTRIVTDPGRFLDAKWTTDELQAVAVTPWFDEHYDFREGDTPY